MAAEGTVLWKCGACEDCFYDLQALANHKCLGSADSITLSEQTIKQLEENSFATENTSDQVEQAISAIAALEQDDEDDDNSNYRNGTNSTAAVPYNMSTQAASLKRKKAKPTIISVNNSVPSDSKSLKSHQKSKRSLVWAYFNALDHKKAMCCICSKVLSYCGTPTNLVYHLNRFHPAESEVIKSKSCGKPKYQYLDSKVPKTVLDQSRTAKRSILKQVSLRPIVSSVTVQKKSLTDRIVELIAVDLLPASIVEGEGFKQFCQAFDPSGEIPDSKKILKDLMPKRYYAEHKKLKELLGSCEKVHLSTELWEGMDKKHFLTVTSHFLTEKFEPKCYTLTTSCLSNDCAPASISTALLSCISDWDINSKVMCIVSDENSDLVDAIKIHADVKGSTHLLCLAHILDNIIKDTFASSAEHVRLIQQCRHLVAHLKQDPVAKQKLVELQTRDKKLRGVMHEHLDFADAKTPNCPLKAVKDVPGHWVSMFRMLQRIFTLRVVINTVLESTGAWSFMLTEIQWLAVEETISLLKAFEVVTLELCTERYPSLSKVIPIVQGLLSLVSNCSSLTLSYIEKIKNDLLTQLNKQLGSVEENITLAVATVLDPRFKNIAFQSEDAVDAAVQRIQLEGRKYEKCVEPNESDSKTNSKVTSYTDSLWASFDMKATPRKENKSRSDDVILKEIKNYFEEPLIDRKRKPILWWKDVGCSKFPALSEIAKRMLSIPSTSVPPERIFIETGKIYLERRQSIKAKYVHQLLFLSTNID